MKSDNTFYVWVVGYFVCFCQPSLYCLRERAETLSQGRRGGISIPFLIKLAGSAEHRAATRNLPLVTSKATCCTGREVAQKLRKVFYRSGADHTTRAQQTLGSNFLTLFLPDYQR